MNSRQNSQHGDRHANSLIATPTITYSLSELLVALNEHLSCELIGKSDFDIVGVSSYQHPRPYTLSYINQLAHFTGEINRQTVYIVDRCNDLDSRLNQLGITQALVVDQPLKAYRLLAPYFSPPKPIPQIAQTAVIAKTAQLGGNLFIGDYVVIGDNAVVADGCQIGAHSVIGAGCSLGENCQLDARVTLYPQTQLGCNVVIASGAVLGSAGFGYSFEGGAWQAVPQLGRVIVGDHSEIGANTCIDRGAIDDTIIGCGVILDNQIHIAHNVHIGDHTAIAGATGIAGSTHIGKHCMIAGMVAINGHLHIADGVRINGHSTVIASIDTPGTYGSAFPALPSRQWNRLIAYIKRLEQLFKSDLKQTVNERP